MLQKYSANADYFCSTYTVDVSIKVEIAVPPVTLRRPSPVLAVVVVVVFFTTFIIIIIIIIIFID